LHPEPDPVTERLVLAMIELIHERKLAGKRELAATAETIAGGLSDRTGLHVLPRHVHSLTAAMRDGGLITVGGGGIGYPNTYDSREDEMGEKAFWDQVDAFLLVWKHPSRKAIAGGRKAGGGGPAR